MKIGVRKPNLKRSLKAKTTGKLKRSVKKATNPLYGKKGVGMIKDPGKAIRGKVYNATTISLTSSNKKKKSTPSSSPTAPVKISTKKSSEKIVVVKESPRKISVITGAHSTTRAERIQETILYTVVAVVVLVVATWALHLTDGWLVMLAWAIILGLYTFALYDTWTRQSTEEREVIDNPVYSDEDFK